MRYNSTRTQNNIKSERTRENVHKLRKSGRGRFYFHYVYYESTFLIHSVEKFWGILTEELRVQKYISLWRIQHECYFEKNTTQSVKVVHRT